MIVSELCANGDLFDYIRNVSPPSLYRVVRMFDGVQKHALTSLLLAEHHAGYCVGS